jgi:hypothetical protein
MKKCISRGFALAAIAGLVLTSRAQDTIDQSQFPTILSQPVDQCPLAGSPVTFSVQATNADGYQWYRNNSAIDGQTNADFTISNVSTNDVGYYSVSVSKGSESVPSRQACLNVYITGSGSASVVSSGPKSKLSALSGGMSAMDMGGGGVITVFGPPLFNNGGTGNCPGRYSGYVNFTKTVSDGWGWSPIANTIHTATDGNRSDTKVQYMGNYGDSGCNLTTVGIPTPAMSPVYRFTVYFPVGVTVPTNAYPITLTGFNP